jgi:S-formylglutathione hydrolase FrmB
MVINNRASIAVLSFLLLLAGIQVFGQTTAPARSGPLAANVEAHQLNSKLMARELSYRAVLPKDYKTNPAARYSVVYLLHGLTGHFDNWTDKTKLAEFALGHDFIIITPEGNNGWYTDSVSTANDKYESYIVQELIPEIDKKFRTIPDREHRAIAGLSMGGYGAIKFGLKYPDKFALVGSFSGALSAASFNEKYAGSIGKSVDAIFGPDDSETRKVNDVFGIIKGLTADKIKAIPFIYQSCGTEDFLFQNNRDFVALLNEKKIPHEYREHPGGHDWKFWDTQVREFLQVARNRTSK